MDVSSSKLLGRGVVPKLGQGVLWRYNAIDY